MASSPKISVSEAIRQSPPVDFSKSYDANWLKGKHALITGGASGFGVGFAREWASHGASIVIGDIDIKKADQAARGIRKETGNDKVYAIQCDVRDWQAQVNMFKEAVKLSPHGGIDIVVANAGIAGVEPLHLPGNLDAAEPKKPDFRVIDVNLYGVLYTTQLALYWLQKNPASKPCSLDSNPATSKRDRMLLLVGSLASLGPIPSQLLYGTSKHAVLGLFRSLRASSFIDGIRVNMICPYFIETAIMNAPSRLLLAGGAMGQVSDVVDAATRLVADTRILGRALCVGPSVRVKQREEDGEWIVIPRESEKGEVRAIWEAYADDFEDCELFTHRIVNILKGAAAAKGWAGWLTDLLSAFRYALFG